MRETVLGCGYIVLVLSMLIVSFCMFFYILKNWVWPFNIATLACVLMFAWTWLMIAEGPGRL